MTDSQSTKPTDKIPRGAIAVVVVGLVITAMVIAIDLRGGGSSAEVDWATTEEVKVPKKTDFDGKGLFELRRTTISAIPPNGAGELIYRIAGVVVVDSAGEKPTNVTCRFVAPASEGTIPDNETTVARTPNLRAAWPRPSEELKAQEVPESLVVKFNAVGNKITGVPIRDQFNRYTNSASPTLVDWGGYEDDSLNTHSFIWDMADGTGPGPAALGYAVVFKAPEERPKTDITCAGEVGSVKAVQKARAVQQEYPVPDDDAEVTEADPELDVE
ncbi:MAG: hypothetical protein ACSLFD_12600 [Solirubrobacterales bacterium]